MRQNKEVLDLATHAPGNVSAVCFHFRSHCELWSQVTTIDLESGGSSWFGCISLSCCLPVKNVGDRGLVTSYFIDVISHICVSTIVFIGITDSLEIFSLDLIWTKWVDLSQCVLYISELLYSLLSTFQRARDNLRLFRVVDDSQTVELRFHSGSR